MCTSEIGSVSVPVISIVVSTRKTTCMMMNCPFPFRSLVKLTYEMALCILFIAIIVFRYKFPTTLLIITSYLEHIEELIVCFAQMSESVKIQLQSSVKLPLWAKEILDISPEERTDGECRRLHALLRGMKTFDKFTEKIQLALCKAFTYQQ